MVEGNHKRGVGLFSSQEDAEQALQKLKESGFAMEKVSVVARRAEEDEQVAGSEVSDHIGNQSLRTATGAVADTLTNASWASVLVGLTSLALPGIGPILAAGSVGAALVASTAGVGIGAAATSSLNRAMSDLGIPRSQADVYSTRLIQGDYLVFLEGTEAEINQVAAAFEGSNIQEWGVYDVPQTQAASN